MKPVPSPFADLGSKTALVTGASSGLGAHFARVLARHGAKVIVGARRGGLTQKLADDLCGNGMRALGLELDVRSEPSVKAAFEQAQDWAGSIDILVNNAGIGREGALLQASDQEFAEILDVNLVAVNRCARYAARSMVDGGTGGSIINIASIAGVRPAMGVAAYSTSKAAVIQLTRSMAVEWARHDIRVNAIAPGYIETDINRAFFQTEAGAKLIERIPQRRLGVPEDLDGALLLLASDASSNMTASVITVDGGHSQNRL